jgi:hypothetical protein
MTSISPPSSGSRSLSKEKVAEAVGTFSSFHLCFPSAPAGLLLGLMFDTEDRGDTFLRNVWVSEIHGVTTQKIVPFAVRLMLSTHNLDVNGKIKTKKVIIEIQS